jgi:hypothetical protein
MEKSKFQQRIDEAMKAKELANVPMIDSANINERPNSSGAGFMSKDGLLSQGIQDLNDTDLIKKFQEAPERLTPDENNIEDFYRNGIPNPVPIDFINIEHKLEFTKAGINTMEDFRKLLSYLEVKPKFDVKTIKPDQSVTNSDKDCLVIHKDLLKGVDDYSTDEVYHFISNVMPAAANLFRSKDKDYNGSWQNKGILSAQSNFERKVDRVVAQFYNGTMTSSNVENIADTFIDSAMYSFMYLFLMYKKSPEIKQQVDKFIEQYGKD